MSCLLLAVGQVSAGLGHTVVVCTDGGAYGLGLNADGQLGTGDRRSRSRPALLELPDEDDDVVQVSRSVPSLGDPMIPHGSQSEACTDIRQSARARSHLVVVLVAAEPLSRTPRSRYHGCRIL